MAIKFFDKLEDEVRSYLSHRTILFGFVVGFGVVLFWRGVWHSADTLVHMYAYYTPDLGIDWSGIVWWDGPLSIVVGAVILLLCGAFVSEFIGKDLIISGLKKEKTISEKTEKELLAEGQELNKILKDLDKIKNHLKIK